MASWTRARDYYGPESKPAGVEVMGMTREKAIRLTWAQQGRVFWNCFQKNPKLALVALHVEDVDGPVDASQYRVPDDVMIFVRETFRTGTGFIAEQVVCEGHVVLGPRPLGRTWRAFECVL